MDNKQPISTFLAIAAAVLLATSSSALGVNPCPEDTNGDGVVNVLDLIDLLLCFGLPDTPPCDTGQDINGDGTVNVLDLIDVLLAFGTECPPPAPANLCANCIPITDGLTAFSTVGATTDGPAHVGSCLYDGQTHRDIWYNYTAPCTGTLEVTTCEDLGGSADYDTDLVVYDGCDCGVGLEDPPLGCNDDDLMNPCGFMPIFHSTVAVPVVLGQCYKVRVGGFSTNDEGTGNLSVTCQ